MTSLPPSSKYLQRPTEPVREMEREALTSRLSDAFADGRLPQEDYMALLDVVYSAQTLSDLVPVAEQLPAAATNVPDLVPTGVAPAGQFNKSRNILVPAMIITAVVLLLLVILAVLLGAVGTGQLSGGVG